MLEIVLTEPGKFKIDDTDHPGTPEATEAVARVVRIGVCGTDLHAYRGRQPFFSYPRRLGHELGVEIVEVGSEVKNLNVGDMAAVEPYLTCGKCIACRAGKTNCCVELKCLGVHTDGGMCEYIKLPANKFHTSKKLTIDQLALVETLGIGCHAVNRAQIKEGEWVLVIGAGPIGLAAAQFALAAKAQVVVMDVNDQRLQFCRDELKVQHTINATGNGLAELSKLIPESPSVVFECTGNVTSMTNSFTLPCNGGRLVFVGLVQGELSFNDPAFHRKELTLMSSRNSTARDFKKIISMIEDGLIDTTPWITHRVAFGQPLIDNFESWLDPSSGCIKAMIELK